MIFSICDVLREMTKAIFEIKNLKTTALVEEIEVSILITSILFTVTEKLLTKSSLKKHLFENSLLISYLWSLNQQREDSFKSTQKIHSKSCCERVWSRSKCKQQSLEYFSSSFFIFKYCQLQSFYDLFEIDKIFFDELDDLVRNMMIFNFEHQLIHRFIWLFSFHKFYAFLDSFLTLFRIDSQDI